MGAPISCLIAAYVSCVVLSYSNNNYGVCMVRYTIYKYAWYSIQVYKVIERLDGVMVGSVHTQYAGTPLGC